jgi:hypothetical protein
MKEWIMVISMWGSDGNINHYIGQLALQEPMTERQCEYMLRDGRWAASYENDNYSMQVHCYPKDCAGKDKCD